MDNKFLMQEEIDALLRGEEALLDLVDKNSEQNKSDRGQISSLEADILGEIGNISMGSAATTLSQLLNSTVMITSPKVKTCTQEDLFNSFDIPYMAVEVDFTEGLQGLNLLIMKTSDASVIADLMMGGDGKNIKQELSEFELSAASEAMNQMMGSSATSMSEMFSRGINISPPRAQKIDIDLKDYRPFEESSSIVVVSFQMTVGDLIDTEIMQVLSLDVAKEQAGILNGNMQDDHDIAPIEQEPIAIAEVETAREKEAVKEKEIKITKTEIDKKYDLILDIPLKVSVVLGKSKKSIGEVLRLMPGSIVELDKILGEDVEILVNDTIVATGEVVVVNENFGVRVTNIISPAERINYIK